jgi:hypothetical protein
MDITVLRVTLVSPRPPLKTDHTVFGEEKLNSEVVGAFE